MEDGSGLVATVCTCVNESGYEQVSRGWYMMIVKRNGIEGVKMHGTDMDIRYDDC